LLTSALLALALFTLPARAEALYRVEIGGEWVGWARLALRCDGDGDRCRLEWESGLRAPEEAGGGVVSRRIEADTSRQGDARAVRVRAEADGQVRRSEQGAGPPPAGLAELLLSSAVEGELRCQRVRDEGSGREGDACARRQGPWLEGAVLGEPVRFRAHAGALPEEVDLPAQGVRFISAEAVSLPQRAPRLHGALVPAAEGALRRPRRFCGVGRDPAPSAAPPDVPRVYPPGATCRERTTRYLALAAGAGIAGRHAVGVAHDGAAFVWHEWAELLVRGRWIPVDPAFEQAPAEGPRFTLGRWRDGVEAERQGAGRSVLACWGRAAVEP
jgi:hypothetical protein